MRKTESIFPLPERYHPAPLSFSYPISKTKGIRFPANAFWFYISGAKTRSTERSSRRKKEWSCASSKVIS